MNDHPSNYPTLEAVEEASHLQLARWYRFLPSPATSAIGKEREAFEKLLKKEAEIMNLIHEKFMGLGGMTTQLSKEIGL